MHLWRERGGGGAGEEGEREGRQGGEQGVGPGGGKFLAPVLLSRLTHGIPSRENRIYV